jgi:hypothetical protein
MDIEVRTVDGYTDVYGDRAYNEAMELTAQTEGRPNPFHCAFYPVVNSRGDLIIVRDMHATEHATEQHRGVTPAFWDYAYYPAGGWVRVVPQPQTLEGYEPPAYGRVD